MGLTTPTKPEESLLILRAQQGERSAFDALVSLYKTRAYQFAMKLSGNEDDAADMVAEAFIRAFKAIQSFRSEASFSTWLFRILSNAYLDMHRRDKSRKQVSIEETMEGDDGEMQRQFADDAPNPQELAELSERSRALKRAIRTLPPDQRLMILLFHSEEKSYEEIADIIGHPIGTVKSRMNRARLNLRKILSANPELFPP